MSAVIGPMLQQHSSEWSMPDSVRGYLGSCDQLLKSVTDNSTDRNCHQGLCKVLLQPFLDLIRFDKSLYSIT